MTAMYCDGCSEPRALVRYVVQLCDGSEALARWCDACAALAWVDYAGTVENFRPVRQCFAAGYLPRGIRIRDYVSI